METGNGPDVKRLSYWEGKGVRPGSYLSSTLNNLNLQQTTSLIVDPRMTRSPRTRGAVKVIYTLAPVPASPYG